jgi:hypothetical protein
MWVASVLEFGVHPFPSNARHQPPRDSAVGCMPLLARVGKFLINHDKFAAESG